MPEFKIKELSLHMLKQWDILSAIHLNTLTKKYLSCTIVPLICGVFADLNKYTEYALQFI